MVLLFLYFSDISTAQVDKTTKQTIEVDRPELILKWSPSPLISFTAPTMQFSIEYPLGKKTQQFYIEHDLGYVFSDPNFSDGNSTGFRVGTRLKYYFREMNTAYDNFYVSFMGRYTLRAEKGNRFFERAGGAYEQRMDYTKQNKYAAGYLELGYFGRFGENDRITFEVFGGGGINYYTNSYTGIPEDAEEPDNDRGLFMLRTNAFLPSIIAVLKFGYILK